MTSPESRREPESIVQPDRSLSRRGFVRIAVLATAGLAVGVMAGGCGSRAAEPGGVPGGQGQTIGVALSSMNHNFFIGMRQGVEEELAALGYRAEVIVAEDSASAQQQQVDQLIQKGVAAIIMVPVDAQQAVNPVRAANQVGIPVFCIDRRVSADGADVTCTVETDNAAMGEMAARHALELLCKRHNLDPTDPAQVRRLKTTVIHLWGLEAASSAQDRAAGFQRVFNESATPEVTVLKRVGNFNAKTSQETIAATLAANPAVELVYCHNDDNAIGALNAVIDVKRGREAADDPQRVLIVGMDGNRAAIEEIRKGNIEATVSQEPIEMGRMTVRQVDRMLKGGSVEAPYIPIDHHLVTRQDAEEAQGSLWADRLKGGV
jgi:ribose transport system substrate-binding protein